MSGQKLFVNSVVCEARKADGEELAKFEKIYMNTVFLLVDKRSKALLQTLPVEWNVDRMIQLEEQEEVGLVQYNGLYEITADMPCTEKKLLCVNGTLVIHPGTEEVMKSFLHILVNGRLSCPKSMSAVLCRVSVNGRIECYPDGSTVMEKEWIIDRFFPVRAKEGGNYFAERSVEITDDRADIALLVKKGVRIMTKELYVLEEKLADCIDLFPMDVKFQVIPKGYRFVKGDTVCSRECLLQYGSRLYIKGDMVVSSDQELASQIEGLYVTGTLYLTKEQFQKLREKELSYGSLKIVKGDVVWKKQRVTVDAQMLSTHQEGISLVSCASVQIAPSVQAQELEKKVCLIGCAFVKCSINQKQAVEAAAQGDANVQCIEEEAAEPSEHTEEKEEACVIEQYVL
ncbi:MAG: hypothetical protein K2N87_19600 [Eubacterium sp.]|nr:hypothetical protein [Eubacterium sp.]